MKNIQKGCVLLRKAWPELSAEVPESIVLKDAYSILLKKKRIFYYVRKIHLEIVPYLLKIKCLNQNFWGQILFKPSFLKLRPIITGMLKDYTNERYSYKFRDPCIFSFSLENIHMIQYV